MAGGGGREEERRGKMLKMHTMIYLLGHPQRGGLYRSASALLLLSVVVVVVCGHSLRLGMSG